MAASDEREVDSDLGGCLEDLVPVQDNEREMYPPPHFSVALTTTIIIEVFSFWQLVRQP